jgi:hypothetical protein
MPSCVTRTITPIAAFAAALALSSAALAGDDSVKPNYTFSDGTRGFALQTHGGAVSPGVFVHFLALADPPGEQTPSALNSYKPTFLDITDGTSPTFYNEGGSGFIFQFYHSFGDGSVRPLETPNTDGNTSFRHIEGGHVIDLNFHFGGGQVDPESWTGFPGQVKPPGDGISQQFSFLVPAVRTEGLGALDIGRTDAFVSFNMTIDGDPITFSVTPEPSTWAMMILGFGGAGAVLRRRRRTGLAIA